jgi:hypothetical protein
VPRGQQPVAMTIEPRHCIIFFTDIIKAVIVFEDRAEPILSLSSLALASNTIGEPLYFYYFLYWISNPVPRGQQPVAMTIEPRHRIIFFTDIIKAVIVFEDRAAPILSLSSLALFSNTIPFSLY